MNYDGSLKFDTKIDTAEFAEVLKQIQEIAKSRLSKVEISVDIVNSIKLTNWTATIGSKMPMIVVLKM